MHLECFSIGMQISPDTKPILLLYSRKYPFLLIIVLKRPHKRKINDLLKSRPGMLT